MKITLDITKEFNSLINHDCFLQWSEMKPYLFFEFPLEIVDEVFEFELMNFELHKGDSREIDVEFKEKSPYFDDILYATESFGEGLEIKNSILIFKKAKFKITGVKGVDVQLRKNNKSVYHSNNSYIIEKGDFKFNLGGFSEFSPHYAILGILANCDAKASVTFSAEDYVLINDNTRKFDEYLCSKQTPYNYKTSLKYQNSENILKQFITKTPKTFNHDYTKKYFDFLDIENGIRTQFAIRSELIIRQIEMI